MSDFYVSTNLVGTYLGFTSLLLEAYLGVTSFYHGRVKPELAVETVASLVPDSAQMRLRTAPALDSSIGSEDLQALLARRLAESRNGR